MPYDKGDFTQQGIDGKVAGGLLLNNKRDVDVLVSTNEDDSTLGLVAVTIEDHLNDLHYAFWGENLEAGEVYEIGAGGGGGSPIRCCKVNVENTDVSKILYADHYGDGYAIETYMGVGDMLGSLYIYIPSAEGLANGGDYKTNGVIAEPGETGIMYLINSCWSVLDDGDWKLSYFLGALSKSATNITYEVVDNVTVTEDTYYYYFSLTDPTKDGELNLTVSYAE